MQYEPSFVGLRPILSEQDRQWLHRLTRIYPLARFKSDHRNYEETVVDFVYTSAKIEGNTYDRIDADNLLRFGVTPGGKRYSDAVMLVNLRNGFERVMGAEPNDALDLDYVCDLHKITMRHLLPINEQSIGRSSDVNITGSVYTPLPDASRLRTELGSYWQRQISIQTRSNRPFICTAIWPTCNTSATVTNVPHA
jgi:Fic family protein